MARRSGPAKRLLVLPALLLVTVLVGVHLTRAAVPREPDPALAVDGVVAVAGEELRCTRTDDPLVVDAIRAQLNLRGRVTSKMVLACPAAFDGLRVHYVGELVGDLLDRDGGAWVTVNDDDYALEVGPLPGHRDLRGSNAGLAVWLPHELVRQVEGLGGPGRRGDVWELTGTVVRTDPADGGGLTLRADTGRRLARATVVDEPLDVPQLWFALGAVVAAGTLAGIRRHRPPR